MYNSFFGFKESPFQLVPNPEYLFLSRSHEEAIAHLNYAISNGDGFVELTGEVGTGKTTLCRAFLEDLDENTELAYIFNPSLNALELLKTINDDFGIPSNADNAKDLIDKLNEFLIQIKLENKNAILLIDEAQNLTEEVLEQLRLLSNLETNTNKLLQIILVGQPELREKLDSYQLRQLQQRITLSWYLTPLNRNETKEYIRHRVNIASKKTEDKFTRLAHREIYKYAGGIPRLINIVCDRALLTAYGLNQNKVTQKIVKNSIDELIARKTTPKNFLNNKWFFSSILIVCFSIIIVFLLLRNSPNIQSANWDEKNQSNQISLQESVRKTRTTVKTLRDFEKTLLNLTNRFSRFNALKTTMELWDSIPDINRYLNNMENDPEFFQLGATQNNFNVLTVENDLELVKKLNLPAILEFMPPGVSSFRYLTLIKITGNQLILMDGQKSGIISIEPEELKSYWSGRAYILWKNYLNYSGNIPLDAKKESILTLKILLREMGYTEIKLSSDYDEATQEVVKKIQKKHGLDVDGIVGDRTKIVIYNEKQDSKIPHLRAFPFSN